MIHALLLVTLATAAAAAPTGEGAHGPYAQAFWQRDLHGLVLLLSERPRDAADEEAHALYGDVVRLLQCEPLPPLVAHDPRAVPQRRLLRLEEARRARLGAGAARSATLWRDVLDPDFFRRSSPLAAQGLLLRWPVEEERWSDETTDVTVKPSACATPVAAGDELALLGAAELAALQGQLPPEAGVRLAYHRAVRLLSRGEVQEAHAALSALGEVQGAHTQLAALQPSLRPWVQLMRLELGLDPAEGYLALVQAPELAPVALLVHGRAAAFLADAGRWLPLLRLAAQSGDAPAFAGSEEHAALLRQDLLYRRALTYHALGNTQALRSLLQRALVVEAGVPGPALEGLRGLALESLARAELDAESLALLDALGPASARLQRLVTVGGRALAVGNVAGAEGVAAQLLRQKDALAQARGFALQADLALAQEDRARLERSVRSLLQLREGAGVSARQRDELDAIAMQVAQSLVLASARLVGPGWQPVLGARLEALKDGVHSRHARAFVPLFAALADRPAQASAPGRRLEAFVSVGEVAVGAPRQGVPPPAVSVPWPEPYSLLSLPQPDGSSGDGFSRVDAAPTPVTPAAGAGTEVTHAP